MPAATWRKWYPHDIEKWNSSPAIQMLSDAGYRAYHSLVMAQWESEDGFLVDDERLLQTLARVKKDTQWKVIRDEVLSLFKHENGKVFAPKQREEWLRAKVVSERKGRRSPDSGKSVARVIPASGHNNNNNINTPLPPKGGRRLCKVEPGISPPNPHHAYQESAETLGFCAQCGFSKDHESHKEAA
jgi:uncharacterized protein YdaU (DUF1376 family)